MHIFDFFFNKMQSFVSNITFKSDTFEGSQEYNPPLNFDNKRFNYFIKILNVRFSNNVPNITSQLSLLVDGVESATVPVGLYEIADLITLVNNTQSTAVFSLDNSTGHMTLKNNDTAQHVFSGSLINSIQFGQFTSQTLAASETVSSPKMCQVSDFNFFKLCSNIIAPTSYESQGDKLIVTNTLYTFAATIAPFGHKDFASFQDIAYPLNMDQFQRLDFSLTDENGHKLILIPGSKSDFNIQAVIVKELKL